MDIGSIFLILAVILLTGLYIARPFFERRTSIDAHHEHELSMLLAERDRVINALSELDFDHALNKIPEEDYPLRRRQLVQQGAETLRQLDELQGVFASDDTATGQLESALDLPAHPDDALEARIAARRRAREEKSGGFCPQCGGAVVQSDRFCPKCGAQLS